MKQPPMSLKDRLELAAQACHAAGLLSCEATCREAASALSASGLIPMSKGWIEAAKCPECDGSGFNVRQFAAGEFEQVPCQWCDERLLAVSATPA